MHQGQGTIDVPFRDTVVPGAGSFREKISVPAEGYFPGYDYIGFGMYSHQVEAYLAAFDDVKIILYEDFSNNTLAKVNEIIQFLGLKPLENIDTEKRLNVSGTPRSPLAAIISRWIYKPNLLKKLIRPIIPGDLGHRIKMNISRFIFKKNRLSPTDRQVLIDIYRQDILRLQKLLDRDITSWLENK